MYKIHTGRILTVLAPGELSHSNGVQIAAKYFGHNFLDIFADSTALIAAYYGSSTISADLANTLEVCEGRKRS